MLIKIVSRKALNSRLYLVFLFFILFFAYLFARLIYVQVVKSQRFSSLAGQQHNIITQIPPQRGTILDRKSRELALNTISYSIFASADVSAHLEDLAAILGIERASLAPKLTGDKSFVWLKRKVRPEVCAQIKDLNLAGIGQIKEYNRFFPNSSLASHVLGFTDVDNKGLEGIELYWDSYLAGTAGWRLAQRDAKRREVICWGYKSVQACDGYDLVLTIDSVIQSIAERHLRRAAEKFNAASATAIVMEPKTGEILALCNYPDYDLNNFGQVEQNLRRNLAITDLFEPGSSFKFVTAAAALEEKKATLEDRFNCEQGTYSIGKRILHDYRPYGELTFAEVIAHSSNIGTAKIAQGLGAKPLYNYIKGFGFGSLTGIDLPGEVKGIVRPPNQWSKFSLASIAIGQEIAVTPLQLINAVSCLANGGILVKPKIIELVQDKDGKIIKSFPTQNLRRVISTQTADQLTQVLAAVVETGTGKKAKVPGYATAGKTGTAQKARPEGGYYNNKYVSSFVGFVPAQEPRISILVILNDAHPQYFGGTVAAPVFRDIAVETLRYLEMSEDLKETADEAKGAN